MELGEGSTLATSAMAIAPIFSAEIMTSTKKGGGKPSMASLPLRVISLTVLDQSACQYQPLSLTGTGICRPLPSTTYFQSLYSTWVALPPRYAGISVERTPPSWPAL